MVLIEMFNSLLYPYIKLKMEKSDFIGNVITIKTEKADLVYLNFCFYYTLFSSLSLPMLFCIIFFPLSLGFVGFGECHVFFLIKKSIMRKILSYESL